MILYLTHTLRFPFLEQVPQLTQIQPFLAASLFVKITSRQDLLKVKLLMLLMSQNSIP